ncbi:hypothetical protein HBI23_226240 [Parastagonospora nodorum]|nr:hypothetical protein HBI23_226240 [Parastagonospora nodorum]
MPSTAGKGGRYLRACMMGCRVRSRSLTEMGLLVGIWYLAGMQVQGRAGTTEGTAFGHESMAQARNGTIRLSDLADLHARSEAWMRALTSLQGSVQTAVSMFSGCTIFFCDGTNVCCSSIFSVHSCNIDYNLAPNSSFDHVPLDFLPCCSVLLLI